MQLKARYSIAVGQPEPVAPFISGKPLQSLTTEPTVANAAEMFRVTREMASTLAIHSQPAGKLMVNSVGDILRHEKLRRLKKASRLFFRVVSGRVLFFSVPKYVPL